jgi:hypothetical protein
MEITGKIRRIGAIERVTPNFCKRRLTLEYKEHNQNTVQVVEFELKNGNVEVVEGFSTGDMVRVYFRLSGREVTGKEGNPVVYNSLDVWRLSPADDPLKSKKRELVYDKKNEGSDNELWF